MKSSETIIRKRKSIRSYDGRPLTAEDKTAIENKIQEILQEERSIRAGLDITLVQAGADGTGKLGTYGVIKGAQNFLCMTVNETEEAMEIAGYEFEKLVLYATGLGLGTVWLAGTFNRSQFRGALKLSEGRRFPIVSPIGYPSDKKRWIDAFFRKNANSDNRRSWDQLFFENDFDTPLSREHAGDYALPLEMLRLAPSAVNFQPWRILKDENGFHFYRARKGKGKMPLDLQRLDVGIAACHFELMAEELGLAGSFIKEKDLKVPSTEQLKYLFTWKSEDQI